jgi:serine/threonine protein phosphatase 1
MRKCLFMGYRTFAIGDIHGELPPLLRILERLPPLDARDTLVFVGDYIDRGEQSKQVVDYVRRLPRRTPARVVFLRGNHEDAWLRVIEKGWPEFVLVATNGCRPTMESFVGRILSDEGDIPTPEDLQALLTGTFFPPDIVEWMRSLRYFYEDEHAIYVHAGLARSPNGGYLHPAEAVDPKSRAQLLWCRDKEFVKTYRGKRVVFGHTMTSCLPPELSSYTPDDPGDIWIGPAVIGLDTGCGKGGFLTAIELPAMRVYESR